MIKEIIIGKKYKVINSKYTRTPLFIHNEYVFYEHDYKGLHACSCCCITDFKIDNEEIPDTQEEWFEVIYRLKGGNTRPSTSDTLYRSKADFLNYCEKKEAEFEFVKLRKVEL